MVYITMTNTRMHVSIYRGGFLGMALQFLYSINDNLTVSLHFRGLFVLTAALDEG